MIGAGCPLSSIPAWMAVPKQKLKGQHVGVSVEAYVRAIEAGTSSLPRETSLRLRRPDDDGDVLDGSNGGPTILKRGRVCKRGRRTNAVNPNHVELILYAPGRLAWSRKSGSITSVAVAKCDLRRPGSHTFCIETPFGHERSFRCEKTEDALSWVNEINAILTAAPCSPGFRPEHFAHTPIPPWRRRLRNFPLRLPPLPARDQALELFVGHEVRPDRHLPRGQAGLLGPREQRHPPRLSAHAKVQRNAWLRCGYFFHFGNSERRREVHRGASILARSAPQNDLYKWRIAYR